LAKVEIGVSTLLKHEEASSRERQLSLRAKTKIISRAITAADHFEFIFQFASYRQPRFT